MNLESLSECKGFNVSDPTGSSEYPFDSATDTIIGNAFKRSKSNNSLALSNDAAATTAITPNNNGTAESSVANTDEVEVAAKVDVISVDDLLNAIEGSSSNYDCLGVSYQKRVTSEGADGIDLPLPHEWGLGSAISMTSRERSNYNLSAKYL